MSVAITRTALIEQGRWLTVQDCKRVLVVVHTVTYAQRLRAYVSLLEADLRVQVIFTVAPHAFGTGVVEYLHDLGITTVPWSEAVSTEFDLALAAGSRGMHEVRAPVVRVSHGASHIKQVPRPVGSSPDEEQPPGMLSRTQVTREGRVVPAALAYAHERDVRELARFCPEAVPVAHVVGDPCVDGIRAGVPRRDLYRRALGVGKGQQLVVVSSTWGATSTFGRLDALLPQLIGGLPRDRYRVAFLIHPNVWAGHGRWQVRSWLAGLRGRPVAVVPPEADWQSLLIAADVVVGDHGSLTAYTTLTDAALILTPGPGRAVSAYSPAALLSAIAPVMSPLHSLDEQLRHVTQEHRPGRYAEVAAQLSSVPGQFHRRMRGLLYRQLALGEPARDAGPVPPPLPPVLSDWETPASQEAS
ncbi:hypothetical protein AB0J21_00625 [Streptomyces sp. NPDC049954]|uniref:hypothetical protein n=1 Tax=Streptomyces sp. NPDC049954 TaxID=3155779 RepID=UPI003426EEEB